VIAFIFADLIVLPIVAIYRKYYGGAFAARIVALMFVTMVAAALVIDGIFSAAGLIPSVHPKRSDVFQPVGLDYKLVLNLLGLLVFGGFFALTMRRGATDPVCRMTVDRAKARTSVRDGVTYYFCSEGCRQSFETGAAAHGH
jgi:YHS domain-containing protein